MAGGLPGRAPPEQGPLLQGGAGGPVLRGRPVRRRVPVQAVVVRRVDRGPGGRQAAHCPRKARLPAVPALGPLLARAPREGLREVSGFLERQKICTLGRLAMLPNCVGVATVVVCSGSGRMGELLLDKNWSVGNAFCVEVRFLSGLLKKFVVLLDYAAFEVWAFWQVDKNDALFF